MMKKGVPRIWNRIEENKIDDFYKKYKDDCYEVFELFKSFKLIKCPMKIFNYERNDEQFNDVMANTEKFLTIEENSKVFYKPEEILVFRRKFDEAIELIFDDAKRRHSSIFKNNLPWWGWALILYLGYDDFLRLAYSYWIIPVTLIFGLYGVLHVAGLGSIPTRVIYMIQDNVIKRIQAVFNK